MNAIVELLNALWLHADLPSVILMVSMSLLVVVLAKWHSDNTEFDFRKALIDPSTSVISFGRLGHFVCLVTSTAVLLHQTAKDSLNDWLFIGYMAAWAGTFVASKALDIKATSGVAQEKSDVN